MTSVTVSRPWGDLNVEVAGQGLGSPVVLLHSLALSAQVWEPVSRLLGATRAVVAVDRRGHGRSGWDGGEFEVSDLALDVIAAIEALELSAPTLVGMSMGGCVALEVALRRGDLLGSLILADTTASYGPRRVESWRERAERALGTAREAQLPFQEQRWFTDAFRQSSRAEVDRICEIFVAADSNVHAASCRALGGFDRSAELDRVGVPTRIIVGERDEATPMAMAMGLHAGIAGSELITLDGVKHFGLFEVAPRWTELLAPLTGAGAAASVGQS